MRKLCTLTLLFIVCISVVCIFESGNAKAEGAIYIRANGIVEGTDKIQRKGNIYTFTAKIYESITVERDNIIVDGAGYCIDGQSVGPMQTSESTGILIEKSNNITIRNLLIQHFLYGIHINGSQTNRIVNCNFTDNSKGIFVESSSDVMLRHNLVSNNFELGIHVFDSIDINIRENMVENNGNAGISIFLTASNIDDPRYFDVTLCEIRDNNVGIRVLHSINSFSRPHFSRNRITENNIGIQLESNLVYVQFNNITFNNIGIQLAGSDNRIDHNNFLNNTKHVYDSSWDNPNVTQSVNTWYEGDTGNYWDDYNGTGETAYVIDKNNQDNFPTKTPLRIPPEPYPNWSQEPFIVPMGLWLITITAILGGLVLLVIFFKKKLKKGVKVS